MTAGERLHEWKARVRALFGKRRLDADLEEELRFHLDKRAEDYGAAGLETGRARAAASRRFGNLASLKEACRDAWTFEPVETLAQDLRFALRVLRKNPSFTAVVLLSLALGIGANAAMFSLVRAVLLRPLPYPEADRLVRLTGLYPKGAVVAMQERSRTVEIAGVGASQSQNLTGHGEAARLQGSSVSANFFAVLRRGAARGRVFETGEDQPGRDGIVVLSHALWESRFQGDPGVLGRRILLDGVSREIVGVMPPGFHFPSPSVQLWVPIRLDPRLQQDYWNFGWMPLVARLRPGATLPQAQDELTALVAAVTPLFPWKLTGWNVDATALSLQDDLVRDLRRRLLVLQAAVGLVLLIACANAAGLLLARAAVRAKEMALRAALGARRGRLLRQLLTESLLLSLLGGALGAAGAVAMLAGLRAFLPADLQGFSAAGIDGEVLAFVTALSTACGLAFGLVPAATASRIDLSTTIKRGGQRAGSPGAARLRASFVAAEVALAVVLTVGAGLLVRTLFGLSSVDPGFEAARTLSVRLSPGSSACPERAACVALYDEVLRRLKTQAGVEEAAAASTLPLDGSQPLLPVEMEGHPFVESEGRPPLLWAGAVTPTYFRLLGIPVLRGRGFEDGDSESAAAVVVVSAATVARYWPGEDPIGKRIRVVWEPDWRTVVGVAGDVRQYALSGRAPAEIGGALYLPYPQSVGLDRRIPREMTLFVRSAAGLSELGSRLREVMSAVNPDVPLSDLRNLDAVVEASIADPRSLSWLFAGFAGCALLLAAIGTYGVVSYQAAQRTYEIGVRMAVGATRADIFGLVVGHGLKLALVGLGLGLLGSLLLGRALEAFLYGVSPVDPLTLGAVGALLLATALAASSLPGRRAAATDVVRALRVD